MVVIWSNCVLQLCKINHRTHYLRSATPCWKTPNLAVLHVNSLFPPTASMIGTLNQWRRCKVSSLLQLLEALGSSLCSFRPPWLISAGQRWAGRENRKIKVKLVMRPSPRPWQEEGGFCNIDELSAGGMTHLELEMERESIKPTVRVLA